VFWDITLCHCVFPHVSEGCSAAMLTVTQCHMPEDVKPHGKEPLRDYLDYLRNCQLLKKDCAAWTYDLAI
jgi:hypothetical protein